MQAVYDRALRDQGTWEWREGHNPKVIAYFRDAGHKQVQDDETAWCAAFVGAMLEREGIRSTRSLAARSYERWGDQVPSLEHAQKGDVVVFWRGSKDGWQGHVGFYAGHGATDVMVLGGNQKNQVNISPYPQSQMLGIRRAPQTAAVAAPRRAPAPEMPAEPVSPPAPAPATAETAEKPKFELAKINKAIVAFVVAGGGLAAALGVDVTAMPGEEELAAIVGGLLNAVAVYWIPNKETSK